jgi:hypothetical protein
MLRGEELSVGRCSLFSRRVYVFGSLIVVVVTQYFAEGSHSKAFVLKEDVQPLVG